jgi:hypothetical protein
LPITA